MKKRIFVGVCVPEHTRQLLTRSCKEWQGLPINWTKKDSLRVSVVYHYWKTDEEIL